MYVAAAGPRGLAHVGGAHRERPAGGRAGPGGGGGGDGEEAGSVRTGRGMQDGKAGMSQTQAGRGALSCSRTPPIQPNHAAGCLGLGCATVAPRPSSGPKQAGAGGIPIPAKAHPSPARNSTPCTATATALPSPPQQRARPDTQPTTHPPAVRPSRDGLARPEGAAESDGGRRGRRCRRRHRHRLRHRQAWQAVCRRRRSARRGPGVATAGCTLGGGCEPSTHRQQRARRIRRVDDGTAGLLRVGGSPSGHLATSATWPASRCAPTLRPPCLQLLWRLLRVARHQCLHNQRPGSLKVALPGAAAAAGEVRSNAPRTSARGRGRRPMCCSRAGPHTCKGMPATQRRVVVALGSSSSIACRRRVTHEEGRKEGLAWRLQAAGCMAHLYTSVPVTSTTKPAACM